MGIMMMMKMTMKRDEDDLEEKEDDIISILANSCRSRKSLDWSRCLCARRPLLELDQTKTNNSLSKPLSWNVCVRRPNLTGRLSEIFIKTNKKSFHFEVRDFGWEEEAISE